MEQDLSPAQIANHWVAPLIATLQGKLLVRLSVTLRRSQELRGNAVGVQLFAGAQTLSLLTAPPPDQPLPEFGGLGINACADFTFGNPQGQIPTRLVVTIAGDSASFDLFDLIPVTTPPPPSTVVPFRLSLLRPDDLLNLEVEALNLQPDLRDPEHPTLVASDGALLILRFPPQTIVEEAFFDSGDGTEVEQKTDPAVDVIRNNPPPGLKAPTAPGTVAARIGEPTRLVFRVPASTKVPLTIEGLLDWSKWVLVVAPIADVAPDGIPPAEALAIRPPAPTETTLQLPYRLHLSPTHAVVWEHATGVVARNGRAELWHTRLATRNAAGEIQSADLEHPVPLRAIWSPDYQTQGMPLPGDLTPFNRLAAMSRCDRHQIVVLTSAFRGYAASAFARYTPQPVLASLLMLSPLGGWLRSFGKWDPPWRIRPTFRPDPVQLDNLFSLASRRAADVPAVRNAPAAPPTPVVADGAVSAPVAAGASPAAEAASLAVASPAAAAAAASLASVSASAAASTQELFAVAASDNVARFGLFMLPQFELDEPQLDLSQWAHIAAQGRDHYVRIVYEGQLKDLGHRASLVKVTERRFETPLSGGGPVAYLRQYMYIVVREPEKDYANEGLENDGRGMPLRRVRLTTLVTPKIEYPYPAPSNPNNAPNLPDYNPASVSPSSFWVMVNKRDFLFHGVATDWLGRTVDFAKPMIFVPNSEMQLAQVDAAFNHPDNRARRAAAVPGQTVAFAPAEDDNQNTSFITHSLNFENEMSSRPGFFKPRLFKADVSIPAIEQMTGGDGRATIRLSDRYRKSGFDDAGNVTGLFAEVVQEVGGVLARAGRSVSFSAQQAGGFATPNLDVTSLTRSVGPLGGVPENALANSFDPSSIFKKGLATLFGVFDLADLLPLGNADKQAPLIRVRRDGTTLVTELDWKSPVKAPAIPPPAVVEFFSHEDTQLTVHAEVRKALGAPANDTFTLNGHINHFEVRFFKVLQVNFVDFTFDAGSGRKTDVNVALDDQTPVQFMGDLEFVEGLRSLIPPGVFGDGVSIDLLQNPLAVKAGLAISLPPASVGVFSLKNVAFSAGLTIPLLAGKPIVDFGFARRDNPFLLAIAFLGGGGFFHIEIDTGGIRMLEAAFEFGAVAALDIGVATGEVHMMAGIYFKMEKKKLAELGNQEVMVSLLSGYLRVGGKLEVLGIVCISVEFNLSFTYASESHEACGRATLTVCVEVAIFSASVDLTVERCFGSKGGDPTFGQLMDTSGAWSDYVAAFA